MTQIRKFIPVLSEYQQAVAIEKANFPKEEITVQSWKWQDHHTQPTTIFSRWVGELDGKIISHGLFTQSFQHPATKEDRFHIHLAVHPTQQRKGYGTELFLHLNRNLHQYSPCIIESTAREDHPQTRLFLEHHKFHPVSRKPISRLTLPINDKDLDVAGPINRLSKLGITIYSLETLISQNPDWKEKLFALEKIFFQETPVLFHNFPPDLNAFEEHRFTNPFFNPQSIYIAQYHQHWIGLAGIEQSPQKQNTCFHTFTGVNRPYRRNGIATVLRQYCINFAVQHNFTQIECYSTEDNPIHHINHQLGYSSLPALVQYELVIK